MKYDAFDMRLFGSALLELLCAFGTNIVAGLVLSL